MLDLDHIRDEFARHLHSHLGTSHPMDAALLHVASIAYRAGAEDKERDLAAQNSPLKPRFLPEKDPDA